MSLGTGALKVGQEPDHLRHSRRYPCQCCMQEPLLHAATNRHHHAEGIQWKILTWPHTYQRTNPKRGGKGWEPESAEIHFNSRFRKISMKCNTSHKISKGPCGHPKDHIRLSRRPLTTLAWNLTLPKLHFSHITLYLYKKYYLSRAWRSRQKTSWRWSSIGHGTTSLWLIVNIFPVREVSLLSIMFLVCKSSKVLPSSTFTTPLPFISWS